MYSRQEWIQVGAYTIQVEQIGEGYFMLPVRPPDGPQADVASDYPVGEMQRVVYINVRYRNDTPETTLSCRRNQWDLYDEEGYGYRAESGRSYYTNHPPLHAEQFINPGGKVRGWLAFKVPAMARLERVQFFTGFLSTQSVDIRLHEG